jgi:lysophospholipase L1-like esterase
MQAPAQIDTALIAASLPTMKQLILLLLATLPLFADSAKPDRWESAIAGFEAADKKDPVPADSVIFTGSSSARMWKTLADDFPELSVRNRGFGGSQYSDLVRHAKRFLLPHRPKAVVLYSGDNDINAGKIPEVVLADFKALLAQIHASRADTRIVCIPIKPSIKRWDKIEQIRAANALLKAHCETDERLSYADIFTPMLDADGKPQEALLAKDKLHLSPAGYALWTREVRKALGLPVAP